MEPIYQLSFDITDLHADRFGRLKSSSILYFVQEAAGKHWQYIEDKTGQNCNLYWVIIRHRVQVSRLPRRGEKIRLETWPMPTTRVAYPRSVVAYDEQGSELFRSISLWVLMDPETRAMVLPGKSGVTVSGILRGNELPSPASLAPAALSAQVERTVRFTDLDVNGHMNNARYLDHLADLLPGSFHENHVIRDMTLGYLAEAREGDTLLQQWQLEENDHLRLEITRPGGEKNHRIFSADVQFGADIL
jgi:acyl-ACP thioesterase